MPIPLDVPTTPPSAGGARGCSAGAGDEGLATPRGGGVGAVGAGVGAGDAASPVNGETPFPATELPDAGTPDGAPVPGEGGGATTDGSGPKSGSKSAFGAFCGDPPAAPAGAGTCAVPDGARSASGLAKKPYGSTQLPLSAQICPSATSSLLQASDTRRLPLSSANRAPPAQTRPAALSTRQPDRQPLRQPGAMPVHLRRPRGKSLRES